MSYGVPERGTHPWALDEERSRPFFRQAIELGINFFDTSNSYSDGTSEEILGRALRDLARRDEVVVATKVYHRMRNPTGPRRACRGFRTTACNACRVVWDSFSVPQRPVTAGIPAARTINGDIGEMWGGAALVEVPKKSSRTCLLTSMCHDNL